MDQNKTPTVPIDPFLGELQKRLLASSDMVSSAPSEIETAITKSIDAINAGKEASAQRIESEAARTRTDVLKTGQQKLTSAEEAQRGFATNTAQINQINEDTNKELKDLDMRKQELLLAGDATAASKISELQLKALEFKQQAKQQAFSNLLNLGQFTIQVQAEKRASDQFTQTLQLQKQELDFNKQSKMAEIATEFGIPLTTNDTLESIVTKALPFATEKRKAEISKLLADSKKQDNTWLLDVELQSSLNENRTPTDAVTIALAKANKFGINVTGKDYERLLQRAVELDKIRQAKIKSETAKVDVAKETADKATGGFFSFLSNFSKTNNSSDTSRNGIRNFQPSQNSNNLADSLFTTLFGE